MAALHNILTPTASVHQTNFRKDNNLVVGQISTKSNQTQPSFQIRTPLWFQSLQYFTVSKVLRGNEWMRTIRGITASHIQFKHGACCTTGAVGDIDSNHGGPDKQLCHIIWPTGGASNCNDRWNCWSDGRCHGRGQWLQNSTLIPTVLSRLSQFKYSTNSQVVEALRGLYPYESKYALSWKINQRKEEHESSLQTPLFQSARRKVEENAMLGWRHYMWICVPTLIDWGGW